MHNICRDFFLNLDNLHDYLKYTFPRMKAPSFFIEGKKALFCTLFFASAALVCQIYSYCHPPGYYCKYNHLGSHPGDNHPKACKTGQSHIQNDKLIRIKHFASIKSSASIRIINSFFSLFLDEDEYQLSMQYRTRRRGFHFYVQGQVGVIVLLFAGTGRSHCITICKDR